MIYFGFSATTAFRK